MPEHAPALCQARRRADAGQGAPEEQRKQRSRRLRVLASPSPGSPAPTADVALLSPDTAHGRHARQPRPVTHPAQAERKGGREATQPPRRALQPYRRHGADRGRCSPAGCSCAERHRTGARRSPHCAAHAAPPADTPHTTKALAQHTAPCAEPRAFFRPGSICLQPITSPPPPPAPPRRSRHNGAIARLAAARPPAP